MIELAFTVCLLAAPDRCEERRLLFQDVTAERCMAGAQPQLAKWSVEHAGWRITRWHCAELDQSTRDT